MATYTSTILPATIASVSAITPFYATKLPARLVRRIEYVACRASSPWLNYRSIRTIYVFRGQTENNAYVMWSNFTGSALDAMPKSATKNIVSIGSWEIADGNI